ncbi:hypothetical protein [Sphingobium subterraneum]|uniref:Uncharacterized protein n=1 Tax=Sphingobium subterraneum TaxID=627688 RepID=A0A841IZU4_9SPHN|nr:hypothetical protein [Sphingobium subterraneum]MBB6123860.1 hypothetical protein [Sphingobium subterraneum]
MAKRQTLIKGAGVILVILAAFVAWNWGAWRAKAQAGSAYAARITCSCRYVEGRTMDSCQGDVALDAGAVSLTEIPEHQTIVGRVPLLGRASAQYKAGYGCLMVKE